MEKLTLSEAERLDSFISGAEQIAIVSHTHPDGDAAGSCVAMKIFLDSFYSTSTEIVFSNRENDSVSFLFNDGIQAIYAEEYPKRAQKIISEAGLIICLDMSSPSRAGITEQWIRLSNAPKVLFDHHLNPEAEFFNLTISSQEVSSTCEIVFKSLKMMPAISGDVSRLPLNCLTSLMTGLTTDTNNFANSVFPDTFAVTSEMLSAGVDREGILMHIYNEHRENRIRLMGHLLSNVMKITKDGVAYIVLNEELGRQYDIKDGELEGMVNIPLGIKSVRISIFVREDDGFLRVSIRSKRGTSANSLAVRYFNGGGHELASGGKLFYPKDIAAKEDAAAYIEKVTAEYFRENPR